MLHQAEDNLSDSHFEITIIFTLSNVKLGESIVIGLSASSTSKGPPVKTTEPMVSMKVTNCIIQLGWILARDGIVKNYMGVSSRDQKVRFFHLVGANGKLLTLSLLYTMKFDISGILEYI